MLCTVCHQMLLALRVPGGHFGITWVDPGSEQADLYRERTVFVFRFDVADSQRRVQPARACVKAQEGAYAWGGVSCYL